MKQTALLVVDVQTALIKEHPYMEKEVVSNISELIALCRKQQIEVIYVRHDDGKDSDLEKGSPGWHILEAIAPASGEKIFDKQRNSAFNGTGLRDYLDGRSITTLVLVGLQTEYCIDATLKVAFEYGYKILFPEGTTTTFDNGSLKAEKINEHYIHGIWKNRFAQVMSLEEIKKHLASI